MEENNKIKTSVWLEQASPKNPFYPQKSFCHGYDFYEDLLGNYSWEELLFLHLRGELPKKAQKKSFSILLASVMNPGPRHIQNRAAMSAAIGGCPPGASLMAGMGCSQGDKEGGGAVEGVMRMVQSLLEEGVPFQPEEQKKQWGAGFQIPGFGLLFGWKDHHSQRIIGLLKKQKTTHTYLSLLISLEKIVLEETGQYLKPYGIFGAGLLDLGFSPEQGHGLFMIASSAGMLTHLCERYQDHWSEYPSWFRQGNYQYREVANE